jgi:hypothetical protein
VPTAEFRRPNWNLRFYFLPALRPSVLQAGTTPNQTLKPAKKGMFEPCSLWMKIDVCVHLTALQ